MSKDISIDVTISNVRKRTGQPYTDQYECDFHFASTASEVTDNGDVDLSGVTQDAKLTFNLKTASFVMNNQTYQCAFPSSVNEAFWIARQGGPPPGKGNAPPMAGGNKLGDQFAVGNDSNSTKAILQDDNDDGNSWKYCLAMEFALGKAPKDIIIDPVIINRQPDL